MSTEYLFTNKTNTEVKKLDLLRLEKRLYDEGYSKNQNRNSIFFNTWVPRTKGHPNKAGSVIVYRYIRNTDKGYDFDNWTWFYQGEEMTWAKEFGENNSEPLLNKITEWLDINWHSEHSELPEIQTFIEQYDNRSDG